jgi:glycosyltransferase involved in cell wall biosynthesis
MGSTASPRPRWLVVAPEVPRFDHAGGDRRLLAILRVVAAECDVFLLAIHPPQDGDEVYEQALQDLGVQLIGRGIGTGISALVRQRFDVVFFEFYYTTYRLLRVTRNVQPHAVVMVDSVDLHYLREREAVRLGIGKAADAANTEREELEAYRQADVTIAVSHAEQAVLHGVGITSVEVIPIIMDIVPRVQRERDPELLFVGGFRHVPNVMAVEWFHQQIWPSVRQRVPSATWIIAGSRVPAAVRALDGTDGIRVLGFVPSTAPLLDSAQISIAPLTYGAGMKSKVCEALAGGVPVVTTTWGAQGLERGAGHAFKVSDDAQGFADAIVELLTDPAERTRLSELGQRLAIELCSAAAAASGIAALLRRSTGTAGSTSLPRRMAALVTLAVGRAAVRLGR